MSLASFKGVAIITGCAAQGIGRAIALRLVSDGFDVALNDLPTSAPQLAQLERDIRALHPQRRTLLIPADVSDEESVVEMVNKTVDTLGGLDVMIANAGICPVKPVLQTSAADFDRVLHINLRGVFLCYREAARVMIESGKKGGRIIGASSLAGKRGSLFGAPYSASKAGIRGMTQALAEELAPHGITVNAYAPGVIETDMMKDASNQLNSIMNTDFAELAIKMSPLHRVGKAEEVAALVSWLAGSESSYMTGQTISINGGIFYD